MPPSIPTFMFALILLLLSGCGIESDDDQTRETQLEDYAASHGVDVDVSSAENSGEQQPTISNVGSTGVQLGSNLDLPEGFPEDVAIYPGTVILFTTPARTAF